MGNPAKKLAQIHVLQGEIKLISGLHVGKGKDSIEIGGLDLPVVKDQLWDLPYIPGSSIKGKMRSMLEIVFAHDKIDSEGGPTTEGEVAKYFGRINAPKGGGAEEYGPTRFLFSDSTLSQVWRDKLGSGRLALEEKYQVAIDRVRGKAKDGALLSIERVPAGLTFELEIRVRRYDGDDWEAMKRMLYRGLALIELDGLGGQISRGSGQVRFTGLKLDGAALEDGLLPDTKRSLWSREAAA